MIRPLLFVLLLTCFTVFSQEESTVDAPKNVKTKIIYPASAQFDIWDIRFGHSILLPSNNNFGLKYFSANFAAHYLYEFNLSKKRNVTFGLGIGYDFQRNHLVGFFDEANDQSNLLFHETTSSRTNIHSLSIPAEMRFRIKQNWKIYIGYQAVIPLKSVNKFSFNGENRETNIESIDLVQHGPYFRLGFKDFFLFSRINFTPLLLTNDYEEVKNLQIGISLGG